MATDGSIWAAFSGLAPLLLGGIAAGLRLFVEPIKEFRQRSIQLEKKYLEVLSTCLSALLNHSRNITADEMLRGDGRVQPDLVDQYTTQAHKYYRIVHRLELLRMTIRWCFHGLLATAITGICATTSALIWPSIRWYVVVISAALIMLQICLIVVNYASSLKLDQYEEAS